MIMFFICFLTVVLHLCIFPTDTGQFDRPLLALFPLLLLLLLNYKKVRAQDIRNALAFFIFFLFFILLLKNGSLLDAISFCSGVILLSLSCKFLHSKSISYFIFFIFIVNVVLSFYEYNFQNNIFFDIELDFTDRFRSTGLFGHPLNNALITSSLIMFTVMSSIDIKKKWLICLILIICLFTYNARAAILSTFFFSFIYLFVHYRKRFSSKLTSNIHYIVFFVVVFYFLYTFLANSELGGKLFIKETQNFEDSSALARIEAFYMLQTLSLKELLVGFTNYKIVAESRGLAYIENSYLIYLFQYGIIVASLFFYYVFNSFFKIASSLGKTDRLIIIFNTLFIGFNSPALTDFFVILFLFLIYQAFNSMNLFSNN